MTIGKASYSHIIKLIVPQRAASRNSKMGDQKHYTYKIRCTYFAEKYSE